MSKLGTLLISWIIAVTLLLPRPVLASCEHVDLRSGAGPEGTPDLMRHIPVGSQGAMGTCYAYAGAGMLDYYRYSIGNMDYHRHSSPLALATVTKAHFESSSGQRFPTSYAEAQADINFGWTENIFVALNSGERICDRSVLEDIAIKNGGSEEVQLQLFIMLSRLAYGSKLDLGGGHFNGLCSILEKSLEFYGGHPLFYRDEIERALTAPTQLSFLLSLVRQKCAQDVIPLDGHINYEVRHRFERGEDKKDEIRGQLHQYLLKGPSAQPVGLRYCADFLKKSDEGQREISLSGSFDESDADEKCPHMHVSLVIGQRTDPGDSTRCQYLIRNSWGKDCDQYREPISKQCEKNGDFWVDEESLMMKTNSLTTILRK